MTPELKPKEEREKKKNHRLQIICWTNRTFLRTLCDGSVLRWPRCAVLVSDDVLCVADTGHDRVCFVRLSDGALVGAVVGVPSPAGMAVLERGTVVVASRYADRIEVIQ